LAEVAGRLYAEALEARFRPAAFFSRVLAPAVLPWIRVCVGRASLRAAFLFCFKMFFADDLAMDAPQ